MELDTIGDVVLAAVVGFESSNVTLVCKDKSIKGAHHLQEAHKQQMKI